VDAWLVKLDSSYFFVCLTASYSFMIFKVLVYQQIPK